MGRKKRRLSKAEWTITDWEGWLWKIFSRYIRLRDCIKTTGTTDRGRCVTCGRIYPFAKLQAGHFIPGRTRAVLFVECAVHAQCYRCNCKLDGAWPAYYRFMQKKYGQEMVEQLVDLYGQDATLSPDWFEQSYEWYDWHVREMSRTGKLVEDSEIATAEA